jgi:hypothetical protein
LIRMTAASNWRSSPPYCRTSTLSST